MNVLRPATFIDSAGRHFQRINNLFSYFTRKEDKVKLNNFFHLMFDLAWKTKVKLILIPVGAFIGACAVVTVVQ